MPKGHFKSVTINEASYDRFHDVYTKNKLELVHRGINSFAAYIEDCMKQLMQSNSKIRFKVVIIENNLVVLRDNFDNKIINIEIHNNILICTECKHGDCMHVGFCYTLHQLYPLRNI